MKIDVLILGAGYGTRMKSSKPKVLHEVSGIPMLDVVNGIAKKLQGVNNIVNVISEDVLQHHTTKDFKYVIQHEKLGTGHAVKTGLGKIDTTSDFVLVLYGDTPLIQVETISTLINPEYDLIIAGFEVDDVSKKYGRIVTDIDFGKFCSVKKIVEFKDADKTERDIKLCNSGVMLIKTVHLLRYIHHIENKNAANEYYLTDLVEIFIKNNLKCAAFKASEVEFQGVNSKKELSIVEHVMQNRIKDFHMTEGVTFTMPESTFVSLDTIIEKNVTIEPFVFIGNNVKITEGKKVSAFSRLENQII